MYKHSNHENEASDAMKQTGKPTFRDEITKLKSTASGLAHLSETVIGDALKEISEVIFPDSKLFEEGVHFLSGVNETIEKSGRQVNYRDTKWRTHHSTHEPWRNRTYPSMGTHSGATPGSVEAHFTGTTNYEHNAQQHAATE